MRILASILIIFNIFAKDDISNNFYDKAYLGEWQSGQYEGPVDSKIGLSRHSFQTFYHDNLFDDNFLDRYYSTEFLELYSKWSDEIASNSACPNLYLNEHINYIQYLFRLMIISYSIEALKANNSSLYSLGVKPKQCLLDWNEVLSPCAPQSLEMKKFLKRVKVSFLSMFDKSKLTKLSSQQQKLWLNSVRDKSDDVSAELINFQCAAQNQKCNNLSVPQVSDLLEASCLDLKRIIINSCSEIDNYFGLSKIPLATELLRKSNTLSVINTAGYGTACLNRYVQTFKSREYYEPTLEKIFPPIYNSLVKTPNVYIQGESFLPGALKEFDDKGLDDFMYVEATPTPSPTVEVVLTPVPTPTPKQIVKVVVPTPTPIPTVIPTAMPTVVPTPKISYFESQVNLLNSQKSDLLKIDMDLFKADYIFTKDTIERWERPIKRFQSRIALEDMKKFDNLGSEQEPVLLRFLKFLLDQNNHQGLYNIQLVLGEKFWVINDIDGSKTPVYIRLLNDDTTSNRWTIILLKHPNKK